MNDLTSKVSIIIPTKNRLFFIKKIIKYYNLINFKGYIYIGDGSNKNINQQLQKFINSNLNKVKVFCYWLPNITESMTSKKLTEYVSTPYAMWSGDDDFFLYDGINKCVKFLDNNKNFIGANGKCYFITNTQRSIILNCGRWT